MVSVYVCFCVCVEYASIAWLTKGLRMFVFPIDEHGQWVYMYMCGCVVAKYKKREFSLLMIYDFTSLSFLFSCWIDILFFVPYYILYFVPYYNGEN